MTVSFMGGVARAAENCETKPLPVQYELLFLSLVERGGTGYLDPIDENGRTFDQLCSQLKSDLVEPSTVSGHSSALTVTLVLPNETCKMDVTLAADGRVAEDYGLDCKSSE